MYNKSATDNFEKIWAKNGKLFNTGEIIVAKGGFAQYHMMHLCWIGIQITLSKILHIR